MNTTHRKRSPTPQESARALAQLRTLFQLTDRQKAERAFDTAKAAYDDAARALIAQEPDAKALADAALLQLNAARQVLRTLDDQEHP